MKEYYAIGIKNVKGKRMIDNLYFNDSLFHHFLKRYLYLGKKDINNVSKKELEAFEEMIPNYIIVEKIYNDFYEVFTGVRVVSQKDRASGEGIYYDNTNYEANRSGVISLEHHRDFKKFFGKWIDNSLVNYSVLYDFVELTRQYKEFEDKRSVKTIKYTDEQQDLLDTFEDTVKKYKKTRKLK